MVEEWIPAFAGMTTEGIVDDAEGALHLLGQSTGMESPLNRPSGLMTPAA
jgi:hypothetical protein